MSQSNIDERQVRQPLYVVVSGNTGTGKSTLLRHLADHLRQRETAVDVADEREFHHPMLGKMFSESFKWAFPIQVHFVLQRAARLLAADPSSGLLLMERSLSEDALFLRYYYQRGDIAQDQWIAYGHLHESLRTRVKTPDLIIHMAGESGRICERLEAAFANGERPNELRGPQLLSYVSAMNKLYDEWSASARELCGSYVRIEVDRSSKSVEDVFETARSALSKVVNEWSCQ